MDELTEQHMPHFKAAELLAASSEFRTMCGGGSTQDALLQIRYPYWDIDRDGPPFPGAVIEEAEGAVLGWDREESGTLLLSLYDGIPSDLLNNPEDDLKAWWLRCRTIQNEMLELSRTVNPITQHFYLGVHRFRAMIPPTWMDVEQTGQKLCRMAVYSLEWR